MDIYCEDNISNQTLEHLAFISDYHNMDHKNNVYHMLNLWSPNLKYCLSLCLDLFNGFMRNSYTTDDKSHIIQVLFLQQIKISTIAKKLIKNNDTVGQEALTRIAFETYIKIKWLLMGTPKDSNLNNRFKKFMISEAFQLIMGLKWTKSQISKIEKEIRSLKHTGKNPSYEQKINGDKTLLHILMNKKEFYEKNLKLDGFTKNNIENILGEYVKPLTVREMCDERNYRIYKWLCSEVHSNIYNLLHLNTVTKSGKYESVLNIQEHPNIPNRISNLIIVLVDSFCIINKNVNLINNELPDLFSNTRLKTINDIALALRNFAIIFHYGHLSNG